MTYHFYSKRDKDKESISSTKASNIGGAIVYFANSKKLTVDMFLELYSVELKASKHENQ